MVVISPTIIFWLVLGTLFTLLVIAISLLALAFILGLILGFFVFVYSKIRLKLISDIPNKLENKIYLLGTIHTIPINKLIKDPKFLDSVFTSIDTIVVEAPSSISKRKLLLKAPLLVVGIYFFKVFQFSGSIIPSLLYKESSKTIQNIKKNLERLMKDYKITDSMDNLESNKINVLKCRDFIIDDWANKNYLFVFLNVFLILLLFVGYSISTLKLFNSNPFVELGVGLVSLVVVLSPIILFLYMIDSTLHQRNKVAVDYITAVFNRNKKPILVLYGKSHINEIKNLLDKNSIDSVIMK
jgi:hypothetical protein